MCGNEIIVFVKQINECRKFWTDFVLISVKDKKILSQQHPGYVTTRTKQIKDSNRVKPPRVYCWCTKHEVLLGNYCIYFLLYVYFEKCYELFTCEYSNFSFLYFIYYIELNFSQILIKTQRIFYFVYILFVLFYLFCFICIFFFV